MVDNIKLGFLVVTHTITGVVSDQLQANCYSKPSGQWSSCYYGCCGNSTLNGFGTTPCCQHNELPQYTYLLLAVGFLIPFIICMMILRRTGERCRHRNLGHRSRHGENINGAMPSIRGRSLMVTTIADLLSSRQRRRGDSAAAVVKPPSYEDAVKDAQMESKPPAYTEVFMVEVDNVNQTYLPDENPPEYVQTVFPEASGTCQQSTSDKSETESTYSDISVPCSSTCPAVHTASSPSSVSSSIQFSTENSNEEYNSHCEENHSASTSSNHADTEEKTLVASLPGRREI